MKTPKDFEYDLWISDDGACMVRIKSTGEVIEVEREVMRVPRLEEKRLRREIQTEQENGGQLFLKLQPTDETGETWLVDTYDFQSELMVNIFKDKFCKTLTPTQLSIFRECLLGEHGVREYAWTHNVSHVAVLKTIMAIRKKFKKYFSDRLPNA